MSRIIVAAMLCTALAVPALNSPAHAKSWDEFTTECRINLLRDGTVDFRRDADHRCTIMKDLLIHLYGPNYRPGEPPPPTVMRGSAR